MKYKIFLLAIVMLISVARGAGQSVTITGNNLTLKQLSSTIKKQTGYVFLFSVSSLKVAAPVTISVKDMPLNNFLVEVFKNQPFLQYSIKGKSIFISEKKELNVDAPNESTLQSEQRISGKITDSLGKPLAFANVIVPRTKRSASSLQDGSFAIDVSPGDVLVVSYVGYQTKSIEITAGMLASGMLNIAMVSSVTRLNDVEITVLNTGYQTISKERATGAFDVIRKQQLEKPTVNIAQRLIGTVAGMQAKLDADGNPSFEIRGKTSLYANASPLVVVDGFAIQGGLAALNPNDIESVTVLKDAAAASIWGARSANGVIVVTTKSAAKGTPLKVDFSAFTRFSKKFDLDYANPLASSAETIGYEKKVFNKWGSFINTGTLNNADFMYGPASTALSENMLGYLSDTAMNSILDQLAKQDNRSQIYDYLMANPVQQQYNLTISGSSAKMSNLVSLMYSRNQGSFKNNTSNNYLFNYRTTANVAKWLDFHAAAMVQFNDSRTNGVGLGDIQKISPYEMLINPDGSYANISQYYWPVIQRLVPTDKFPYSDWTYNPIQEMNNRDNTARQLNLRFQSGFTFKLFKGLTYDLKGQYELFNTFNQTINNEQTFSVRNQVNTSSSWDRTTNKVTPNLPKGSILSQSRSQAESWNVRNQLNYNRIFGRHEVSAVAGSEVNNLISKNYGYPTSYGYNDMTLTLGTFPNGPGGSAKPLKGWQGGDVNFGYTNSFSYGTERYLSLYGNAAYTYNRKYTISGSYRTDASNLITDDPRYRYAPFWSAGVSWQLGKENFIAAESWIDMLNLRMTYGYNGNVDKSTAFRPLISLGTTPNVFTQDYQASIASYGNPTLRWEKTGTWNLGIDYSFFDSRLRGKVDLYNKQGKDLIAVINIPAVNGTTSQRLNNAEMLNKGIELTVGSNINIKSNDIVWQGDVTFSYNRNRITKLFVINYNSGILSMGGSAAYMEGKDANTIWSYQYTGIHDGEPTVLGPDKEFYNLNNSVLGTGLDYMKNSGTLVAPYTFGFINSFKIYDFNVSAILTGKFGHVFRTMGFNYPINFGNRVLPNKMLTNVLHGDPEKIIPLPLTNNEPNYYFWTRFYPYIDYLVQSASHLRMQEINVTYNLKPAVVRALHISGLQVYAQGNDLFTILANKAGEDPEYPMGGIKPQPKFIFGLKASL